MADLWVVLTVLAFFGLCVAFVYGCDRIIGPDDDVRPRRRRPTSEELVGRGRCR